MPRQVGLTIVADVRPGAAGGVRDLLAGMGDGVANGSVVDFAALPGVHFARFVLLEETRDLEGAPLPASLVYMSDLDVSRARHIEDLVDTAPEGIDRLFAHCEGYPDESGRNRETRLAYLRSHVVKEQAYYVNTIGRDVRRVRGDAKIRDALQGFLDGQPAEWRTGDPARARRDVQQFVEREESLRSARRRDRGLGIAFWLKQLVHLAGGIVLALCLLPFLIVAAPVFLFLLRRHEKRDPAPHLRPSPELVQELAALDDHLVHNPFTAIGFVKPGLFRRVTLTAILAALSFATRHVFNNGNLAGVKTIHFARWVFLNENRRVVFASNYDGSLESYMDDFIDKISWGLNVTFSNGYGFPRARWLFFGGSKDELAFKDYLRLHQVPTRVWYSAYGRLTNANIANNARIRAGLHGDARPDKARRWLQAL
jgi:hypothetical protein